mgnify:CR=1 FL=1
MIRAQNHSACQLAIPSLKNTKTADAVSRTEATISAIPALTLWPEVMRPRTPNATTGPVSSASWKSLYRGSNTSPSATPLTVPANGPLTAIDKDGLYAVGSGVVPGTYASGGPVEGTKCYWKRTGADGAIIDNALSGKPQVVTIEATDATFKTSGCQPWTLTDQAPPPENSPQMSQWQLRQYLNNLNSLAGQSGNGQLPPF